VVVAKMSGSAGPSKGELQTRDSFLPLPLATPADMRVLNAISGIMNPKKICCLSLFQPTFHGLDLQKRRLWAIYSISPELLDKQRGLQGALSAVGDNAVTALCWALSLSGHLGVPPGVANVSTIELHTSYFQPCDNLQIRALARVVAVRDQVAWLAAELYSTKSLDFSDLKLVAQVTTTAILTWMDSKHKL